MIGGDIYGFPDGNHGNGRAFLTLFDYNGNLKWSRYYDDGTWTWFKNCAFKVDSQGKALDKIVAVGDFDRFFIV